MTMNRTRDVLITDVGWLRLNDELISMRKQRRLAFQMATGTDGEPRGHEAEIAVLDQRIGQLSDMLANAMIVSADDREPGRVGVGSRVDVHWDDGDEESFTIVGPPEVSPSEGCISYESPVGRSLLGRREGEWIDVNTHWGSQGLLVVRVG